MLQAGLTFTTLYGLVQAGLPAEIPVTCCRLVYQLQELGACCRLDYWFARLMACCRLDYQLQDQ